MCYYKYKILHYKDDVVVLPDQEAKHFLKHWAVLLKDFGRHFGHSKHFYIIGGKSQIFGGTI